MPSEQVTRELRMLAYIDRTNACVHDPDVIVLGWHGAPETASYTERDVAGGDVDFGDEDCDPLPSVPHESGLWLLRWAYEMVPSEWAREAEPDEVFPDDTTAKYAPTCTWTRPTMAELAEFGVLPTPEVPHAG